MSWQKKLLQLIKQSMNQKIAVAVDVSTDDYPIETIRNIISLFNEVRESTPLVCADFKIREITDTSKVKQLTFHSHGRASYTDVLEWGQENDIEKLFYITDVTGHFWEELKIDYDVTWLIPDSYKPQVPFGKTFNLV
ncbi:hypothetical protein D8M04_11940 [Oceanobacillus piezotolerans]|uniref:VWA-like domain-containing protein n=1 Tax=Oceanobacillus piezotolerans TaxID=2448030 RepID=A0A498D771_9BACI|nr:VWA-like domain-containing protein [Oceanobacillus piezotolerans]RLL43628.1 hypothetical protein D8M04_11940 [Oceanobacillus piezotolerans]